MAESYLSSRGYAIADCVTCGDECPASRDDADAQRRWASRHADANPGHSAHLTTERTRVYRSNEPSCGCLHSHYDGVCLGSSEPSPAAADS